MNEASVFPKSRDPPNADISVGPAADRQPRRRLRICLAASGGGHVRQLLDLEPVWSQHDFFFITEDTSLGRSLSEKWPTKFVEHYALGQSKLGAPVKMLLAAMGNFISSVKIVLDSRPDVVISTGAGAVFFILFWARLLGAKIVMIESFARFDRPSKFARVAALLAHQKIIQSPALARYMPGAKIFDPLKLLHTPRPRKRPLVFVTVGATLPFDRLVQSVADLKARGDIPEDIIIQTGVGGIAPPNVHTVETLPFDDLQDLLREADIVICHGGTGSLITALRQGCRVIVMPRRFELGEHYDNHQADITNAFVARGLIQAANSTEDLAAALRMARATPPIKATTDPAALIDYLNGWLKSLSPRDLMPPVGHKQLKSVFRKNQSGS